MAIDQMKAIGKALKDSENTTALMFVLEAHKEDTALDEAVILERSHFFPAWDENWTGKRGTIVQDGGNLYRSIHDVGAGQNTKPSSTPSMWTRIGNPADEWPQWFQPIGAHDAYPIGSKVSHSGKHWVSDVDANVWTPGVYGWREQS